MLNRCLAALLVSVFAFSASAQDQPADAPEKEKDEKAALYKKFEETLTDAVLIGSFTMKGEKNAGKLNEERYEIVKVTRTQDDFWLFQARIKYGKHDLTVPLLLEVKWAGNTPVITLDHYKVPGFGSFTARVLIFNNQYVGTWEGGDHGGQMFGRIEKNKPAPAKEESAPEKSK
ncbi:MAG: hypothetical protein WD768_18020 [Phycisphaeraceae bacterium]